MIIDVNCHLGSWPFRKLANNNAEGLLRLMEAHGVKQACVGAFEGLFYRDCGQANRDLRERIAGFEDRLLPWATINPAFPGWEEDLWEALEAGMLGIRLFPNYHGYTLQDKCVQMLFARICQICPAPPPVAIYHKFVDERLHHWACRVPSVEMETQLEPLVECFPAVSWLLCGCGLPQAQALANIIRSARIWLEISRLEGVEALRWLIDTIGIEHIVFGSHAPYFYMAAAHLKIVEAGLTEQEQQAIFYQNALQLMGSSYKQLQ